MERCKLHLDWIPNAYSEADNVPKIEQIVKPTSEASKVAYNNGFKKVKYKIQGNWRRS